MYEVPNTKTLQFLVGAELLQICFGSVDVILNFAEEIQICMQVSIRHSLPDGEIYMTDEPWKEQTSLTMLLGSRIRAVDSIDGRILKVKFSNGHEIEIADDSDQYESFQIKSAAGLIVV